MQTIPFSNSQFLFVSGTVDSDAAAFLNAAGISDVNQQNAINQLVIDLKTYGLFGTKIQALWPIVGGNAVSHSYNLINPSTFRLTFQGVTNHSLLGVQTDGANGSIAISSFVCSANQTDETLHLSTYTRTTSTDGWDMGAIDNNIKVSALIISRGSLSASDIGDDNTLTSGPTQTNGIGFFLGSRTAQTNHIFYKNGVSIGTNSLATTAPSNKTTTGISICGASGLGGGGSSKQVALGSVGRGLTSGEVSNYYTAVQKFQTKLTRNI